MGRKNKSKFSGKKTSLQDFQGAQSTAEVKYSDSGKNESCENYPTNRPSSKAQTSIFNVENSSRVRDCSSKHENVENAPSERAAEDKCWRDQNSSHRRDSESRNGYVQRASNNMERKTRNGPPSYMDVTEDKHEANQSRRNSSNERKDRHSQMASSNMEQKNRNEQHSHTYDNKVTKDKYEANQSRRNSSSERKDWHIQVSDYSDNSNVAENIETDILESDPRNANWRNRNSDKSSTSNAGESNQAWEIPKHSNRQRASNPPRDNKMEHSRRHFNEDQRSNDDRRDREPKQKGQRNHTRWGPLDESKFSKTSNVYPGEYSQTNNYGKYPRHSDNGADMKYSYNKAVSPEYEEFLEWKKHFAHELKCTISEKNGDLFTAPAEYSLCHCVAEDLRMGSGIAVTFRQTFGKVAELLQQGKQTGEVAVLTDKGRFIYYLVTKEFSNGKPTNDTLLQSLLRLKEHMSAHNVTKLAMPTIGCGLDKLRWEDVQDMLQYVFKDSAVEIVVYLFEQKEEEEGKSTKTNTKSSKVVMRQDISLVDIEQGTILLFIATIDRSINAQIRDLDKKFYFINDYKGDKDCKLGGNFYTVKKNVHVTGLYVKKTQNSPFSYENLATCLKKLKIYYKKHDMCYLGIDTISEDVLFVEKLKTMFHNYGSYYETHICLKPISEETI